VTFPSTGSVAVVPLGPLLGHLATTRFSGALRLEQDTRRYAAWFRGGVLIAAESSAPEDTIGRVALDGGLVDPSAVGESLRKMAQDRKKSQLEILVEMGALTPESRPRAVRMTLTRRALRLFALPHATYQVEAAAAPPDEQAAEPLEPRWVVYKGVRQHARQDRLERELGGSLSGSAVKMAIDPRGIQGAFGFADDELVVLAYLNKGYWEIEDLVSACLTLPREAVLAVVYALYAFDALDVKPATSVPRLRKRPREATQEMDLVEKTNPGVGAPVAPDPPPRPRTGPTYVGPPPPPPPVRAPNGTGANRTSPQGTGPLRPPSPTGPNVRDTGPQRPPSPTGPNARDTGQEQGAPRQTGGLARPTGPLPRPTGPLPRPTGPLPRQTSELPRDTGRAESPQPSASGSGPFPKVNRATLDGQGTAGSLREQIIRKLGQVEANSDYFVILAVPRDASSTTIKTAYFQLAKMYHPDRLSIVKLEVLRPQVEKIFARLSEAYAVLGDEKKRSEYSRLLDSGKHGAMRGDDDEVARATKILTAEEHFRKGEMALRRQLFSLAEKEFKTALELNPDEGEHHAMAAWSTWCHADDKGAVAAEVKKGLNKAIELNAKCVPAFYYLGQLYKHVGDETRAMHAFRRVLDMAEGHVDALREVRLLEMRRGDKKGGGLFDRFRKK
jgi:hypothetical protein